MKKPSSGLGIGLWVVAGLVGAYLLGGVILYFDSRIGHPLLSRAPIEVLHGVHRWYTPVFERLPR